MFEAQIDLSGFRRATDQLLAGIERAASDATKTGAKAAEQEALALIRRNTKRRTGQLEDLTQSYQFSSREAHFFSAAKHAIFIDEGTRPHIIRARRAQFLRFVKDGVTYFRKSVKHPGTAPRPFVRQAGIVGELAMRHEAERAIDRAAQIFNR